MKDNTSAGCGDFGVDALRVNGLPFDTRMHRGSRHPDGKPCHRSGQNEQSPPHRALDAESGTLLQIARQRVIGEQRR